MNASLWYNVLQSFFGVYKMKKVRVAVVGCGVIAPLHIECYQALEHVEVVWLCDLKLDKAKALADKFNVANITACAEDVFNSPDVDAVSICTDHASHADLAISALRQGKDVLCEKALAQNKANLERMLAAANLYPDRIFSGVFQHRFDPINRELHAILSEQRLGTLLTAGIQLRCFRSNQYYQDDAWRGTWEHEGGSLLINQAIHYVDQLLWLTGGMDKIVGMISNITHQGVIETEDTAAAVLKLKCGAIGTIEATSSSNLNWESTLSFHGTEGALEIRDDKVAKLTFKDKALEASIQARLDEAISPKGAELGKTYYGSGHLPQIADFIDAVRNRRPPFISAESAAETVETVFAIYEASRDI